MSESAERLVVLLEARIRDFERNMQRASGQAGTSYNRMRRDSRSATQQMERDMLRSTTRINQALASTSTQIGTLARSFAGGFLGGMFVGGLAGFQRAVRGVVSEVSEMGKVIDRVGLSAKVFQELQFGFGEAGVSASEFASGMETFTRRIGEAATRGNELTKIFEANGVALRDQAGNIRSNEALLRDYANLIKNAATEQEQMTLATEAFGRGGAAFVNALKNGADGFDDMADAAENAGGTIDKELIDRAQDFDDRWARSWRRFEVNAKSAVLSAIGWIDELRRTADAFQQRRNAVEAGRFVGGLAGVPDDGKRGRLSPDNRIDAAFQGAGGELADDDKELIRQLQKQYGQTTILPSRDDRSGGGRAGSRNRAAEAALREMEAVNDLIDSLAHELSLVGATDVERDKANALRQAGSAATDEQRRQIEALVEALHEEAEALYEAERAQQARNNAIADGVGMSIDAMMSIADGSMSAEDAVKRLTRQLMDMIVQLLVIEPLMRSIRGGGFGGLFGGGGGSAFSPLVSAAVGGGRIGLFANGGISDKPAIFGEGPLPEAAVPLPDGRRIPVDLRGAGVGGETRVKVDVGVSVDENGNLEAFVRNVSQEEGHAAATHVVRQNNQAMANYRQNGGN